jgi:hypothetical protein
MREINSGSFAEPIGSELPQQFQLHRASLLSIR